MISIHMAIGLQGLQSGSSSSSMLSNMLSMGEDLWTRRNKPHGVQDQGHHKMLKIFSSMLSKCLSMGEAR